MAETNRADEIRECVEKGLTPFYTTRAMMKEDDAGMQTLLTTALECERFFHDAVLRVTAEIERRKSFQKHKIGSWTEIRRHRSGHAGEGARRASENIADPLIAILRARGNHEHEISGKHDDDGRSEFAKWRKTSHSVEIQQISYILNIVIRFPVDGGLQHDGEKPIHAVLSTEEGNIGHCSPVSRRHKSRRRPGRW